MKPFIITPLVNANPKIIELRTTNLENFGLCPLKFKKLEIEWNKEYFDFGKMVHNAVQAYIFNPSLKEDILEFVCEYKEDYCEKIRAYLNLVDHNILSHGYKAILNEINGIIEIHHGKYKILLEGTADLVFKREGIDGYIIGDIKTSKTEWKEGILNTKLQRYVYTYIIGQRVGFDNILGFEYMIFTKHTHPRFQLLGTYNIKKDEIEQKLMSLVTSYISSLEHDDWPAIKNQYCRVCPLKKEKKCPLHGGVDFNL